MYLTLKGLIEDKGKKVKQRATYLMWLFKWSAKSDLIEKKLHEINYLELQNMGSCEES